MAVKVFAAPAGNLGLVPSMHQVPLSSSAGHQHPPGLRRHLHTCDAHIGMQAPAHTWCTYRRVDTCAHAMHLRARGHLHTHDAHTCMYTPAHMRCTYRHAGTCTWINMNFFSLKKKLKRCLLIKVKVYKCVRDHSCCPLWVWRGWCSRLTEDAVVRGRLWQGQPHGAKFTWLRDGKLREQTQFYILLET